MIRLLHALVIAGFLTDMILTYRYVKAYREMYPKSAWWLAEANPMLKFLMKNLGLGKGIIYGAIIITLILTFSIRVFPDYYATFLLGVYFMNNTYHFANWQALKRLKKSKKDNDTKKSINTKGH